VGFPKKVRHGCVAKADEVIGWEANAPRDSGATKLGESQAFPNSILLLFPFAIAENFLSSIWTGRKF